MTDKLARSIVAVFVGNFFLHFLLAASVGIVANVLGEFNLKPGAENPFAMENLSEYWRGFMHVITQWHHWEVMLLAASVFGLVHAAVLYWLKEYGVDVLKDRAGVGCRKTAYIQKLQRIHYRLAYFLAWVLYSMLYAWVMYLAYAGFNPQNRTHIDDFHETLWRPLTIFMDPVSYPGLPIILAIVVGGGTLLTLAAWVPLAALRQWAGLNKDE